MLGFDEVSDVEKFFHALLSLLKKQFWKSELVMIAIKFHCSPTDAVGHARLKTQK